MTCSIPPNAAKHEPPKTLNDVVAAGYRVVNAPAAVPGTKTLSEGETKLAAEVAMVADAVGKILVQLQAAGADMRWLGIAKTHLQMGFMSLNRAVTKPEGF